MLLDRIELNGSLEELVYYTPSTHRPLSVTSLPTTIISGVVCDGRWMSSNHVLYQLAHAAILVAFMAPSSTKGTLFLHGTLGLGFLLLSSWAWALLCAPDVFSWNFSFMIINVVQGFFLLYRIRPIRFSAELEDLYMNMFLPVKVSRETYKKLVSTEYCTVLTLHTGEPYATQDVTKTDRLALLINGTVNVVCNNQALHTVHEKQFLDSPEFEATNHGDEKFRVTITAAKPCRYIFWHRHSLEYLFGKEPHLAVVMSHLLSRDITNKLYMMNDRFKVQRGGRVDIRLPSVSTAALSGVDLRTLSLSRQPVPLIPALENLGNEEIDDDSDIDEMTCMFPNGLSQNALKGPFRSITSYSSLSSR